MMAKILFLFFVYIYEVTKFIIINENKIQIISNTILNFLGLRTTIKKHGNLKQSALLHLELLLTFKKTYKHTQFFIFFQEKIELLIKKNKFRHNRCVLLVYVKFKSRQLGRNFLLIF